MSLYQWIPAGTFALGWISAALLFRERLLRLTAERNHARYQRDEAISDRDAVLAGHVRVLSGAQVQAWLPRQAER